MCFYPLVYYLLLYVACFVLGVLVILGNALGSSGLFFGVDSAKKLCFIVLRLAW